MKIKKIRKQGTKYKIILENNDVITTYDEVIIKNNILYKKDINLDLLKNILEENKYYDVYNKIVKYIKIKLRSEYDIKRELSKYDIDDEKIIGELKNSNLINDNLFTKSFIHDKILFSSDGPNKIKSLLLKEKIDLNIIEDEIYNLDKKVVLDKLEKLIIKKINSNTKYTNGILKTKLLNYFINLGYDKSDILYLFEKNKGNGKVNNKDLLENEYNKLYNKYKNKYDDYKLKQVIRQKLYQKGFSSDEILDKI